MTYFWFWLWIAGFVAGVLAIPSINAYHRARHGESWSDGLGGGRDFFVVCCLIWPIALPIAIVAAVVYYGWPYIDLVLGWPGRRLGQRRK